MSPAVLDAAGIMDDLTQTRILAQEHLAIELLAQDTHTDIGTVQTLFLAEFARLSATAHIQSFVSVLAAHRVKDILKAQTTTLPAD